MKPLKTHISYFFLVLSLFLVSGNAFAVSEALATTTTVTDANYSVENSSKQQLFEEVVEVAVSFQQADEPSHLTPLYYQTAHTFTVGNTSSSVTVATSLPHRDGKKQLKQQVFPFHFFW